MIRRDATDRWLLIAQTEHARLSGELAALWAAPRSLTGGHPPCPPGPAAVFAIGHHDDGWIDWEAAPRADPETGRPIHFTEATVEEHLAIWRRGPGRVAEISAYAGLLVSHHGTGLTEMKLRFTANLTFEDRAALQEYLREQERFRERVARRAEFPLDAPDLARDVALLRLLDFLSLVLCCGPAETRPLEVEGAIIFMRAQDERTVALEPWPFDPALPEVERAVEAAALAKATYTTERLRRALAVAPRERLVFRFLRPAL